jgi:hypothetical protein
VTPSITPSLTPTPTPSASESICNGKYLFAEVIGASPSPTPTSTPTPTPSSTTPISDSASVGFITNEDYFTCGQVKRLLDCDTSSYYYVSGNLVLNDVLLSAGTVFSAYIDGTPVCVTYIDDIDGSASNIVSEILTVYGDCSGCAITPSPSVTPTNTPTPSLTPTMTPSSTPSTAQFYVYSACTGPNTMVVQTEPVTSMTTGQAFSSSGTCWTYVGVFGPYLPPAGFVVFNYTGNYFTTYTGPFVNCAACSVPAPSVSASYKAWNVTWAWTTSCAPCDLTNGGVSITLYTAPNVTTLTTGTYVYSNTGLTTPFGAGRYIKSGSQIFETGGGGIIQLFCLVGGPC